MIHQEDVDYAKSRNVLWAEETIMVTATERRIGPGGGWFTPTTIVATDKRLLLINRSTFGIRNDYESIPYNKVSSVRYEKGIISCSVFLRVAGYSSPGEQGFLKSGEQEGEIPGLRQQDAKDLSDFIEKMIAGIDPAQMIMNRGVPAPTVPGSGKMAQTQKNAQQPAQPKAAGGGFCPNCGGKVGPNAKFCPHCGAALKS